MRVTQTAGKICKYRILYAPVKPWSESFAGYLKKFYNAALANHPFLVICHRKDVRQSV